VTFVSAVASQGTASINGNTVQASLGSMAANAKATVTIVVYVTSNAGSTITNTATVAGDLTEATLANNTYTVVTPVTRPFGKWMFVS
jgi:D-arabinose 5-phosphate isomerase GutQ